MFGIKKVLVFLFGLWLFSNAYASEVTEANVRALLNKADAAAAEMNAAGVGAVLSDRAIIVINLDIQGMKQVLRPTKHQYVTMLEQGWADASSYSQRRSNLKISITDNKALVRANVVERMTVQGQTVSASSVEEAVVERVGGKLLVTKIVASTRM